MLHRQTGVIFWICKNLREQVPSRVNSTAEKIRRVPLPNPSLCRCQCSCRSVFSGNGYEKYFLELTFDSFRVIIYIQSDILADIKNYRQMNKLLRGLKTGSGNGNIPIPFIFTSIGMQVIYDRQSKEFVQSQQPLKERNR